MNHPESHDSPENPSTASVNDRVDDQQWGATPAPKPTRRKTSSTGKTPRSKRQPIKNHDPVATVSTLIIGAGFAGLGTAIRLKQAGMTDVLILERADQVRLVGRGATIPILVQPVIFPRICIRIRLHQIPIGRAPFRVAQKFCTISIIWWVILICCR